MHNRRLYPLLFVLAIFANMAYIRLTFIALWPHQHQTLAVPSSLRLGADLEHLRLRQIDDNRGRILYKSGLPWSGLSHLEKTSQAARHASLPAYVHSERDTQKNEPVIGEVGLPDKWPNEVRGAPEQGRSGLEYTFDPLLTSADVGYLGTFPRSHLVTPQQELFWHRGRKGADIRTSIDAFWQTATEQALSRHRVAQGAIVVLDIRSRQVLAMASRTRGSSLVNEAVRAQVPGSVFKIVTAAAAFDSCRHSPRDTFFCSGQLRRPGLTLNCWHRHGKENLFEAFAGSCDTAFAALGLETGKQGLGVAAQRLGVLGTGLQQVGGRPVLREAETGRVFLGGTSTGDSGEAAHAAIGQQDVRLSPLQAANLAATVADGGMYRDAQLVLDAQRDGRTLRRFSASAPRRALSPATAGYLKEAMYMAAHRSMGTATDIGRLPIPAAVKTGTAELGQSGGGSGIASGSGNGSGSGIGPQRVNSWMVGFAPYEHPAIAFAVYVGNQEERRGHFQVHQITRDLLQAYMQFQPDTVIG